MLNVVEIFSWNALFKVKLVGRSRPRVKLVGCKSALKPRLFFSTVRSKAMVQALVLLFVALWFIPRGDLFKGSIFLKNRHFLIQERFDKLLYSKNTIIKCGI